MFSDIRGDGRLMLLGCQACQQGEMFPRHPTLRIVDLYHMCIDNKAKGIVPVFKYQKLTYEDYEFLRESVTLGKIECTIIEGEEEEG